MSTSPRKRGTASGFDDTQGVYGLVRAQAEGRPEAVAAVFEERGLSYHELDRRSGQLASYLASLGVGPEIRIGICLERSMELLIGVLGVLRAGGAYVAFDPGYPRKHLAFMVRDSRPSVLLTLQGLSGLLPAEGFRTVCLDTDWDRIATAAPFKDSAIPAEHLAYVCYTSGSTGRPKGVMVSRRGLLHLAKAQRQVFAVRPGERVMQFSSLSYDASIFEILMAIGAAATVVLASRESLLPGPDFVDLLRAERISALTIAPSVLTGSSGNELPELRTLVVAGEPCSESVAEGWAAGRRFFNAYGPCEATVWASVAEVSGQDARSSAPPIGKAIPGKTIHLLDSALEPVAEGRMGELCIGGTGVARGYLDQGVLTAERFLPDPFSDEPGKRLYRTGDLGRVRDDGQIEFLGRADQQIQLRGVRIEPGEIEAALRRHPAVEDAMVAMQESKDGHQRLVAWVAAETAPPGHELRGFLRRRLPESRIPALFECLGSLPRLPNGKLDRGALPRPEPRRPSPRRKSIAPRTVVERRLKRIWSEVLGVREISVFDDFFALGGDSILGLLIVSRARQAGCFFPPGAVFRHPTIAELAAVATGIDDEEPGLEAASGPLRLTPIQRWFFEQPLAEPQHWNQVVALEGLEGIRPDLLAGAVQALYLHHEALRQRFQPREAGWTIRLETSCLRLRLQVIDLSEITEPAQSAVQEKVESALNASLDLATGPLVRVAFLSWDGARRPQVLMVLHHLVVDSVSCRILVEDLRTAYDQLRCGRRVVLPRSTSSYRRWSQRLWHQARGGHFRDDLGFWLSRGTLASPRLPDEVAAPGGAATSGSVALSLDFEETETLIREATRLPGASVLVLLLTALVRSFAKWTGKRCLQIDLEAHGRDDSAEAVDLSRTVGWFTSVFPIVLDLATSSGTAEVEAIRDQLQRVPNRGLSYGVLRYLDPDPETAAALGSLAPSEVSFDYAGRFDWIAASGPLLRPVTAVRIHRGPRNRPSYPIEICAAITGGRLRLEWCFDKNRFKGSRIEWLAEAYLQEVRRLMREDGQVVPRRPRPSGFPGAGLSPRSFDELLTELREL